MKPVAAALAILAFAASPALADGAILSIITKADKARLASFDKVRAGALKEAEAAKSSADYAALAPLIGPRLPVADLRLDGD